MHKAFACLFLFLILFSSCQSPVDSQNEEATTAKKSKTVGTQGDAAAHSLLYPLDPHSFSEPNGVVVKHLDLELALDFDEERITGKATWAYEVLDSAAKELVLDINGIAIDSVTYDDGSEAAFLITEDDPLLGQRLGVMLPLLEKQPITIYYTTQPDAAALQWLPAATTADKSHPFLFTQSQAILARTWLPCQDSPGIRFTYKAKVAVPDGMLALMSAVNPQKKNVKNTYSFVQDIPVPAYLMALTAGNLKFQAIGKRTGVYAEPSVLAKAVAEFEDMERMLEAAEALYGPYVWGRYDVAVMPPSFPFGGMENPILTFATPTILAGDKSLVSLIAHELAHSWSGNLVTNATWNDFWLNEGFTVYFEHRIMEAIYGRDYSEMLAHLSWQDLQNTITEFMKDNPKDTRLKIDLKGRNPDDGVTAIAYDKGYFFLRLVEETVGRERFDVWLRNYFENNKFQSMDTERFVAILEDELLSPEEVKQIGVHDWIYETGLPRNCPKPNPSRFEAVDVALQLFAAENKLPEKEKTAAWTTHEWLHFINNLPKKLKREQLAKLDNAYGFTNSGNAEILAAWFVPAIENRYKPAYPQMEKFLHEVGRRKFLMPVYRSLLANEQKELAKSIYKTARSGYHPVAINSLDMELAYNK
ncbi:MAG: M1 family metallopeptidase [Schleiferiaceae bacterium]|nr:M1 family metallopeptidase [Schleiferiaceae bacterium]